MTALLRTKWLCPLAGGCYGGRARAAVQGFEMSECFVAGRVACPPRGRPRRSVSYVIPVGGGKGGERVGLSVVVGGLGLLETKACNGLVLFRPRLSGCRRIICATPCSCGHSPIRELVGKLGIAVVRVGIARAWAQPESPRVRRTLPKRNGPGVVIQRECVHCVWEVSFSRTERTASLLYPKPRENFPPDIFLLCHTSRLQEGR